MRRGQEVEKSKSLQVKKSRTRGVKKSRSRAVTDVEPVLRSTLQFSTSVEVRVGIVG